MLTIYEIEKKRVKNLYKKVFHHLVDKSVFNGEVLDMWLDDSDKLTPLKLREKLFTDFAVQYVNSVTPSRHGKGGSENNEFDLATFPSICSEHRS